MVRRQSQHVIVIAPEPLPRGLREAIESHYEEEVKVLDSLHALDRYRQERPAIRDHVLDALREIDCPLTRLSRELRDVFLRLLEETTTPYVNQLGEWASSRRSLYRWWQEQIPETPAAFLNRVRRHHADSLLEEGYSLKEAAWQAGYSSASILSRDLRRSHLARDD